MITGTISSSDYLDAQRLHGKTAMYWCSLASLLVIVIGTITYFFANENTGLILVCSGIGCAVGQLFTRKVFLPKKVRRIHSQQKDFAAPFTYTWDSFFLEGKGINGQSRREWTHYAKLRENDRILLLYHADNIFEMFPKRWFRNEDQLSEFRRLASIASKS